jgi:NAD(P)-dependent dehydrogenase (short-subunit alcohol dehydrogenase family)
MARNLTHAGSEVHGFCRSAPDPTQRLDITHEQSIAAAAERVAACGPIDLVIVASGLLHSNDLFPEKNWRDLAAEPLSRLFAVNAIGPALVAKHFLPHFPRNDRAAFAALSARVGSIGDNRVGGWYGYRSSKAALNMFLKTLSIELGRTRPQAICVGLHPGTVDTALSRPFQRGVPPERLFSVDQAAKQLLSVLGSLTPAESGRCWSWDGSEVPA